MWMSCIVEECRVAEALNHDRLQKIWIELRVHVSKAHNYKAILYLIVISSRTINKVNSCVGSSVALRTGGPFADPQSSSMPYSGPFTVLAICIHLKVLEQRSRKRCIAHALYANLLQAPVKVTNANAAPASFSYGILKVPLDIVKCSMLRTKSFSTARLRHAP